MKKIVCFIILCSLMLFNLAGCTTKENHDGATTENTETKKIQIVTTNFPPYDFTRAIVGERADLQMLLKPGGESHSYEPSPEDIIKIQKADVFIYIGGENDAWVDSILKSMNTKDKKIIRLMDVVKTVEEETVDGMEAEHEHEGEVAAEEGEPEIEYDEHIWTAPQNAIQMITAIKDVLCEIDPENAVYYIENAGSYQTAIKAVDNQIMSIVNQAELKVLVFGDRFPFRYFADEFGLEYRAAFNGCSTETEASAKTIAYLIDYVKAHQIKYVYQIELSTGQIAHAIAEQTGAEVLTLHSCHNISKSDFETGKTYLSLMQDNAITLQKGFGVK